MNHHRLLIGYAASFRKGWIALALLLSLAQCSSDKAPKKIDKFKFQIQLQIQAPDELPASGEITLKRDTAEYKTSVSSLGAASFEVWSVHLDSQAVFVLNIPDYKLADSLKKYTLKNEHLINIDVIKIKKETNAPKATADTAKATATVKKAEKQYFRLEILEEGQPFVGATVRIGGQDMTTDKDGSVMMEVPDAKGTEVIVLIGKEEKKRVTILPKMIVDGEYDMEIKM
jgi:hypothetical protein